jgi:DNA-binding winged helix-turn-helix (wHTH) protein
MKPKEFDLLAYLMRNPGQVFGREQLLDQVWGYDHVADIRTVDVHVRWLREKIEKRPSKPTLLETVRGVGYRFCEPAEKKERKAGSTAKSGKVAKAGKREGEPATHKDAKAKKGT